MTSDDGDKEDANMSLIHQELCKLLLWVILDVEFSFTRTEDLFVAAVDLLVHLVYSD